jgi:sigma-B regulation protein RsbU (phosphoserine phosphatase)
MQIRKLYRTIEAIAAKSFAKDEELLKHVLDEITSNRETGLYGGRAWKFESRTGSYVLLHQVGEMDAIKKNYRVRLKDYPVFTQLPHERTVLAKEEDQYLRKRGIFRYSATGVGEKLTWRGKPVYKYVLAFNADHQHSEDLTSTLNIISAAVTTALRSRKLEAKAKVLERDLDKARDIQRSILPEHEMKFHKYDMYGVSLAERIVGGDFFDYLQVEHDTERLGVVIGDATSKGVSAAVEALYVSGALRMGFEFQTKISDLLKRVNKLVNKTFSDDHFISLFYCELTNDKSGLVLYSNCGHNSPLLYRAESNTIEIIETTGQLIGPFPKETFRTENFHMKKGDILLLYTDGVTEARNEDGIFYGEERLSTQLVSHRKLSPMEITQRLLDDVQRFSAMDEHADDKTILTIKRS